MKKIIILMFCVLFSGCLIGGKAIEPVIFSSTSMGYRITCEGGFFRCFNLAKKYCPDGYDILKGQVINQQYSKKEWRKCKKYGPMPDHPATCQNGYKLETLNMDYQKLELIIYCGK